MEAFMSFKTISFVSPKSQIGPVSNPPNNFLNFHSNLGRQILFGMGAVALLVSSYSAVAADVPVGKFSESFREMSNEKLRAVNEQVNSILKVPFFFVLPHSAYLPLQNETLDRINEGALFLRAPIFVFSYDYLYSYPTESNPENKLQLKSGLRLVIADGAANRASVTKRLMNSEILKPGDVVLSFRPEWAGTGAYPHIQLGVSHAGIIYTEGDTAYNLDMPLDEVYNGAGLKSALSSAHYQKATMVHIMRPRLSETQRNNVNAWTKKIRDRAPSIYKNGITFNTDYQAPKYDEAQPEGGRLQFVADLGRLALGIKISQDTSMYCSEFAWSVLSLRDCDPVTTKSEFETKDSVPSCVKPIFNPIPTIGNVSWSVDQENAEIGSVDGPIKHLGVLNDALPFDSDVRWDVTKAEIEKIFEVSPLAPKMSAGHTAVADTLGEETFGMIKTFFDTVFLGTGELNSDPMDAKEKMRYGFNTQMKRNYSPTAFVLHAMLTPKNKDKSFDYVGTILFATPDQYKNLRSLRK
jgi:hypothetical protein